VPAPAVFFYLPPTILHPHYSCIFSLQWVRVCVNFRPYFINLPLTVRGRACVTNNWSSSGLSWKSSRGGVRGDEPVNQAQPANQRAAASAHLQQQLVVGKRAASMRHCSSADSSQRVGWTAAGSVGDASERLTAATQNTGSI